MKYILRNTGAIGDMVIASALQKALCDFCHKVGVVSASFTLPLWKGLEGNPTTYPLGNVKAGEDALKNVPDEERRNVFDISQYRRYFPQSDYCYDTQQAHLSAWMGFEFAQKASAKGLLPDRLSVHPSDVRIRLTREEELYGDGVIGKLWMDYGKKPVVVISPYSTTPNRNIPRATLDEVARGISGFATPALLTPVTPEQDVSETVKVGDKDLRKAAAILLAANGYLGVDSGPLHMVAGAVQGVQGRSQEGGLNKIVVVLGSSSPVVVSYGSPTSLLGQVKTLVGRTNCSVQPCGNHGYWPNEGYQEHFQTRLGPARFGDNRCIYTDTEEYACMKAISAEEIIEAVRARVQR